jgi:hypothetical protein
MCNVSSLRILSLHAILMVYFAVPPYSIAQALEKTPSTVSGYTTASEALGRTRPQSTSSSGENFRILKSLLAVC